MDAENLLDAVKMAYRKHVLDDPEVGWDELSDRLRLALCDAMEDEGFVKWLDEVNPADVSAAEM